MNLRYYVERLTQQATAIAKPVEFVSADQSLWQTAASEWSMLEVVNHLYDEEIEDFRIRLQLTLSDPQAPWPANDPVRKVTEREYNRRELLPSLQNFLD